jgi:tetratricopeptide (TPR) repeat protein
MLIHLPTSPNTAVSGAPSSLRAAPKNSQVVSFPVARASHTQPPPHPTPPSAIDPECQQALLAYQTLARTEPHQPHHWLEWAHLQTLLQLTDSALTTLTQALTHHPFHPDMLLAAGGAATAAGQHRQALKWYGRLVNLQPTNAQALFQLALTQETLHQWQAAQTAYERLLAQDPDWIPAYHNLGFVYWQTGHTTQAIALFKTLRSRHPQYWQALLGLALAYDHDGQHRPALKLYSWLSRTQPQAAQLPLLQARILALREV